MIKRLNGPTSLQLHQVFAVQQGQVQIGIGIGIGIEILAN